MVYLVRIRFCRWLDRYLIYQPFAPLEARILAKRGRKEWDEATSPNSMTSLALYGLLRSLILARNAIPRIADFHDRSSRAFRYVFGYTYMYVCKITCACNLHTHVYTHTFIYIHTIVLTEAHELVCMKITPRKRAHVLSHDPSSHQKHVKQNYSFPGWR
jgi:hypothetical protein